MLSDQGFAHFYLLLDLLLFCVLVLLVVLLKLTLVHLLEVGGFLDQLLYPYELFQVLVAVGAQVGDVGDRNVQEPDHYVVFLLLQQ